MNKIFPIFLILLFLTLNPAFADDPACSCFYPKLSELPYIKLVQNNNGFESIWNGECTQGCEIIFKSHESIVSGHKVYDTFQSIINGQGWTKDNNLIADGPGSSSVGIEKDISKCAIHCSQHAWIDENTGEHGQSSDIEMIIQCSSK
jgi:hypothetical protein